MPSKQRFGHIIADLMTVENGITVTNGLTIDGVPLLSTLDTNAKVFFVDPTNGSDSNVGTKEAPFAGLQTAIDACTDDNGDVIVRMPGSETPTSAITVDKAGVTIIASTYGTNLHEPEKFSTYPDATYTSGPMVIVQEPCAIIGLEFVTRNTSHGNAADCSDNGSALSFDGDAGGYAGGFSLIKNCRFVDWWGNAYGLYFRAGAYNRVEECTFEGFDAGVAFASGTRNPDYNVVTRCKFVDCTNGIEHIAGATPHNFLYYENWFIDYTDAIDFNNQAADGLVAGNYYETATDATTYDITVAAAQALGIQFSGNNYSE
jgi:hypothetical protein